jgi:hypothetical protein
MQSKSWWLGSALCAALAAAACDDDAKTMESDAGADAGTSGESPIKPTLACDDDEMSLYGDPGSLPTEQGAILRCSKDAFWTKADVQARLDVLDSGPNTYQGKAAEGGVQAYRILYKTERGNGVPGYSVASVYLPEKPRAEKLPLLLLARGSRGQAPGCAPSQWTEGAVDDSDNLDGRYVHDDYEAMLWPLVAGGFIVVATDSAGYANYGAEGNPVSGYADTQDMAKSLLDSGHALKKLVPDATTNDVLMVGLSQGGHTVLSAVAVAGTYPTPGKILGAAVYAPLWFAQRSWGVALTDIAEAAGIVLNKSSGLPVSIWYHYTHAELLDGPGEGVKLFKPEAQDQIKTFIDNVCWSREYVGLAEGGRMAAKDYFDPAFIEAASYGAANRTCEGAADVVLCQKWLDRYNADHPVFSGAAAEVPILIAYGLKDTTIEPKRLKCGIDKIRKSANPIDFCIDPDAGHAGIVLTQSDYVNEWLANKATGAAITTSCPSNEEPAGLACDPLLPND